MKLSVTVGAQLLWGGRYGCNNGRYGCTIVMSYIEINKAVSQWLLTFNLCVSVTWPLTCAFHIPCTHTPEIIDMHRGVCDKVSEPSSSDTLSREHWENKPAQNSPHQENLPKCEALGSPNTIKHGKIPLEKGHLALWGRWKDRPLQCKAIYKNDGLAVNGST